MLGSGKNLRAGKKNKHARRHRMWCGLLRGVQLTCGAQLTRLAQLTRRAQLLRLAQLLRGPATIDGYRSACDVCRSVPGEEYDGVAKLGDLDEALAGLLGREQLFGGRLL